MSEPLDPDLIEELYQLYCELQIAVSGAGSALKLSALRGVPDDDLQKRFRHNQAEATALWQRIAQLQDL